MSDEVLEKAQAAIDEVQAYGNKGIAVRPKEVPIELKIRLTFKGDVSEDRKRSLALEARREVGSTCRIYPLAMRLSLTR